MNKKVQSTSKTPARKREHQASNTQKSEVSPSINSPVDQILQLQKTIGNRVVRRLIESGMLQKKLHIGKSNDIYEQEADRVADQVMAMSMSDPGLQRQPEAEEEEAIQPKPQADLITSLVQRQVEPGEEEEPIQTKTSPARSHERTPDFDSSINSIRGGGQSLPEFTSSCFGPRLRYDFSRGLIHVDSKTSETARAINTKTVTSGKNVVFGAKQYSPETDSGKRLLTHELTHVVQQNGRQLPRVQPLKTGEVLKVAPLLGPNEKMPGGSETPGNGFRACVVNSDRLARLIDQPDVMYERASEGYDVCRKTGTNYAYAQLGKKLIPHEFVRSIQQREKQGNVLQRTVSVKDHDKIPPHLNSKDYKKNIEALGLDPDDKKKVDEFYKNVSTIPFMDKTAGEIVESLLKDLCGGGKWKVDATGGEVFASQKDFCTKDLLSSPTPVSCACLCKTTEKDYKNITLEITSDVFKEGGGMATPEGGDKFKVCISGFGNPNDIRGVGDTKGTAFAKGYQYLSDPPWLILGHEMCGHVEKDLSVKALKELVHVMTETYQSSAVDIENAMRREHSTAGRNYGIRLGDFSEPGGDTHFGLLYETKTEMSVKELLKKFGIPSDKKQSVYTEGLTRDYFITCPTDPKLDPERSIPVFKGIFGFKEDLGSRYISASCDDFKFSAGEKVYLEGVFAHKVISGETKDSITAMWQVSLRAMETANKDINALDTFKNTDPLPKDLVVLIPYNKGAKDIFFLKPVFKKEESNGYINTQGAWLVDNPSKYKTTRIRKLPKDMFVLIEDEGEDKSFNKTIDRYKWWKIRPLDTMEPGWVMQRFITKHTE